MLRFVGCFIRKTFLILHKNSKITILLLQSIAQNIPNTGSVALTKATFNFISCFSKSFISSLRHQPPSPAISFSFLLSFLPAVLPLQCMGFLPRFPAEIRLLCAQNLAAPTECLETLPTQIFQHTKQHACSCSHKWPIDQLFSKKTKKNKNAIIALIFFLTSTWGSMGVSEISTLISNSNFFTTAGAWTWAKNCLIRGEKNNHN